MYGYTNGDFAYILVFLLIAVFGVDRILGLDTIVEEYEVGERPLVKQLWMRYLLG